MSSWLRNVTWIWLFAAAGAGTLPAATSAEKKEFDSASAAYSLRFWERADRELGDFLQNYPASEFRTEAQLFQAEARIKLRNFAGAIQLLDVGPETSGRLADEYLFWLAEAHFQGGNLEEAGDAYARFVSGFPNSPRVLDAIVAEAAVRSQLKQWTRVTDLLSNPEGRFQLLANASPGLAASIQGRFLLADAQFAQTNLDAATRALEPLVAQPLETRLAWQRDYLRARILLKQNLPEEALVLTTNLATLSANLPAENAEGTALQAGILEQLGQLDSAVAAWRLNLRSTAPPERQREALLHIGDLMIDQNQLAEASQVLETFLANGTNSVAADVVLLTLGELRVRTAMQTNGAAFTNLILAAQESFSSLLSNHPSSTVSGKAQLGLGWSLWLAGRTGASLAPFQAAVDALPPSYDQAVARFKLADAMAGAKDYAGALTNYHWVASNPAGLESVRTNLVEQALYQVVRMARESGDAAAANSAMASLLDQFPNGLLAERSLMSMGTGNAQNPDPVAAREVFREFATNYPDSKLLPKVELAIARTYEEERSWTNALEIYDAWLERYTNDPARARTEYYKALTTARIGDDGGAFTLLTNYVARFPTNEFTPLALFWIGDHYWQREDYVSAETYYQLLFKNHPGTRQLSFEAQFMAGRAAFERRPEEAVAYFTNLILSAEAQRDTNIQAQAYLAYGDTMMVLPSTDTNRPYGNLELAIQVFSKLAQINPNTRIALLAQGKIGDCYLKLAALDTNAALANYSFASNAYQRLLTAPNAHFPERAQAEVGLGLALEKSSQLVNGTNGPALAWSALDHYLNVVFGNSRDVGEPADMYWVKRAGLEAVRLAESLQAWEQVARLCEELSSQLPPLQPMLERKRLRAEEQMRKTAN